MKMGRLAGVLAIIGALLLIVSMFLGWYTIQFNGSLSGVTTSGTENLLPGSSYTSSTSCSGSQYCPASTSTTNSYSSTNQTSVGNLMMTTQYLLIGGFVLGLLGAILGFAASMKGRENWATPAMILVVLALLLALVTPVYVYAAMPGAFSSDTPSADRTNGSGPWSSFFGSSSSSGGGSVTWGGGIGWDLAWGAFVLFLIAVVLLWRDRMAPKPAEPSMSSTMPAPMDAGQPPASPPGGSM